MSAPVIILGAGLSGMSAAYHLSGGYRIFEKEERAGGLCRSEQIDGFTFDHVVHVLYTSDKYAYRLIHDMLEDNIGTIQRKSWVYSKGVYTPYPFQANLFGLPTEVIKDCILGLMEAIYEPKHGPPDNFEEWAIHTFGRGIAKYFMIPFNHKVWAIDLKEMGYQWISQRVLQPSVEEVLEGALRQHTKSFGPNAEFWYPRRGGIEALPRAMLRHVGEIEYGRRAVAVQRKRHLVEFEDGSGLHYENLISTLPLPFIIPMVEDVPPEVREATERLRYNTVYSVNLGIDRADISDKHWIYFPEDEFVFHRISLPMNFSPHMAREGTSSVTVEIATSADKPVPREGLIEKVIDGLIRADLMRPDDRIIAQNVVELTPAYVIYHKTHAEDVETIHRFLKANDIFPCGRFGDWSYLNMDRAILSGQRAAQEVRQ